jgi:lysozyme
MKTSNKGVNLIKSFEGYRSAAYKCPAGVWTIGYGHTGRVDGKKIRKGMKTTTAKAVELLKNDLAKFEKKVNKYWNKYHWTQNEFDALVSFAYNVGSIRGLTAFGMRSRATIARKMLLYNKASGRVLAGLTNRRIAERKLFITDNKNPYKEPTETIYKGCAGEGVKWVQWEIKQDGYNIKIDGDCGKKTDKAIRKYQKKNGLVVDGKVGSITRKYLKNN